MVLKGLSLEVLMILKMHFGFIGQKIKFLGTTFLEFSQPPEPSRCVALNSYLFLFKLFFKYIFLAGLIFKMFDEVVILIELYKL